MERGYLSAGFIAQLQAPGKSLSGPCRLWMNLQIPASASGMPSSLLLLPTSAQFSPVAQLCPTLCDLMNCSTLNWALKGEGDEGERSLGLTE